MTELGLEVIETGLPGQFALRMRVIIDAVLVTHTITMAIPPRADDEAIDYAITGAHAVMLTWLVKRLNADGFS